jgi:hypothetical protein
VLLALVLLLALEVLLVEKNSAKKVREICLQKTEH